MEPYRYHVYVCDQKKSEGVPCCSARGSVRVIEALRQQVAAAGLDGEVQITTCGSLGLCERGPNIVVYPEAVWYSGVQVEDVATIVQEHFKHGRPVESLLNADPEILRKEITDNKKKMLAAFSARDAAGVLPDDFQQMIRGFQPGRVLLTAIELDVFSVVGSGARVDEIAIKIGTNRRATRMLLDAVVALDVLKKADGKYYNTRLSERYLVAGARDDTRAALMHTEHLWPRWSTLTDCVRQGTSVTYCEMVDRGDEWTTAFIAAMHRNATARAPIVTKTVGLEGAHWMLDVGGGSGAYSIAFARLNQNLRVEVFDLPTVLPIAQGHIQQTGLSDRITTRVGDLRTDDLGSGFDLILLSAICHMLGVDANQNLLERCFAALSPGGRVVIQDFILTPDRTAPRLAALFALNLLVGTPEGSTYTHEEYLSWLKQVGFEDTRHVELPGPTGLVLGSHP